MADDPNKNDPTPEPEPPEEAPEPGEQELPEPSDGPVEF